jgi:hypothetical protein
MWPTLQALKSTGGSLFIRRPLDPKPLAVPTLPTLARRSFRCQTVASVLRLPFGFRVASASTKTDRLE